MSRTRKNKGAAVKTLRDISGCRRQLAIGILICSVLYVLTPISFAAAQKAAGMGSTSRPGAGAGDSMQLVKTTTGQTGRLFYENTIKNIIQADCARCHSGATRNLTDYDSLKAYADSGLLATMVQGPMRRFAGNDTQVILKWIQNGAPEKSPVAPARFGHTPGDGPMPQGPVTYNNTIKYILDKDCIRCHSGPFRNLTTYENVKRYADNGLLKTLVLPGGPMHRFAGPDTREIVLWINSGAQP